MIPLLKMVALLAGSHVVVHLNLMPEKHVAKYAARMQIVKVVNGAGLFMRTIAVPLPRRAILEAAIRKFCFFVLCQLIRITLSLPIDRHIKSE